jgi:hypothetical protein
MQEHQAFFLASVKWRAGEGVYGSAAYDGHRRARRVWIGATPG